MFGLDWKELAEIGLALTLIMEAPGEIEDLKEGLKPNPVEELVCILDDTHHVVESGVTQLHYNPDRSWDFVKDKKRTRITVVEEATCYARNMETP